MFKSEGSLDSQNITQVVRNRVSEDMRRQMGESFTVEEVQQAIHQMKSTAAPGPDGLPALFYQKYWDTIGEEVTSFVLSVLNNE
ncbi:hypothetical protein A2U01_0049724, partial [Trifolium medium]|nr:hypothetical protein [Trifolium medium]